MRVVRPTHPIRFDTPPRPPGAQKLPAVRPTHTREPSSVLYQRGFARPVQGGRCRPRAHHAATPPAPHPFCCPRRPPPSARHWAAALPFGLPCPTRLLSPAAARLALPLPCGCPPGPAASHPALQPPPSGPARRSCPLPAALRRARPKEEEPIRSVATPPF
ncbi:MAG: hypothetical protein J3K34DRAFT_433653, partial [Monoraphidium minutum]